MPVVRFNPGAGPGELFHFSPPGSSAPAAVDRGAGGAAGAPGGGAALAHPGAGTDASTSEIEYGDNLFRVLESVDVRFDAEDDQEDAGLGSAADVDAEAAALLREIAEQPDLSEQIFGSGWGRNRPGAADVEQNADAADDLVEAPHAACDGDDLGVGDDDLLSVLLNGSQSVRAVCRGELELEGQLIRRLFSHEGGGTARSSSL